MRQMKFRAWDGEKMLDNYQWIDSKDPHMKGGNYRRFQFTRQDGRNFVNGECSSFTHTVMQFTGLQDKNDIDIYEGDIVCKSYRYNGETKWDKPSVVKFSECDASVQGSVCDVPILCFNDGYPLALDEEYKIIGNIHRNPELL